MIKLIILLLFCTSCTLSIIITSTHGVADDVVDSEPKTESNIEAEIPLSKL